MFFTPKKSADGLIKIDDNFATLIDASESESDGTDFRNQSLRGDLTFLFNFKVSQIKAIEQNALSVAITIKNDSKDIPVIFSQNDVAQNDKEKVVNNILQYRNKIDNINRKDKESFLLRRVGDISSKVSNQLLNAIKTNQPLEDTGIKKTKIILKKKSVAIEDGTVKNQILPVSAHKSISEISEQELKNGINKSNFSIKKLYHNMLYKHAKPVSNITLAQSRNISTFESTQGLLRKSELTENVGDPTTEIINSFLFSGQTGAEEYTTIIDSVVDDMVDVSTTIKIRQEQLNVQTALIVKFELLQTKVTSAGARRSFVLESVTKTIDLQKHIQSFFQAKKSPTLNFSATNDKIILLLQNKNGNNTGVSVFKKTINNGEISTFKQITKANLSSGTNRLTFNNAKDEIAIYRVVPNSSTTGVGSEFSDVVVRTKKKSKKLVIIPTLVTDGVKITAYRQDPLIKSAGVLARNITLKQSQFAQVENLIFNDNDTQASVTIKNLNPYNIYEFCTNICYDNGDVEKSINTALIEYLPYEGAALRVQIPDLNKGLQTQAQLPGEPQETITGIPDVSFTPEAIVLQDQIGRFKQLSEQISKSYGIDIVNQKNSIFDKLILFEVTRYNKTTGDVAYLGVVSNREKFIDSERSPAFLAKKVVAGNEYQYVLNPLLRDPASILEGEKNIVDIETKKSYNFDPVKQLHPIKLKKGTSVSKSYLESSGKDEAIYGRIGSSYSVDVSYKLASSRILNFEATRANTKKVYLKWSVQGNEENFDHFIILKQIENVRTTIGKSHSLSKNLFYVYELSQSDVGNIKFVLIPIHDDYSVGDVIYSNNLLIEG
jgi:hypothetical protein